MKQRMALLSTLAAAGLAACAPIAPPAPPAEQPPAAPAPAPEPVGVAIPHGHGYNIHFTDPKPGEMEMIAASGVKWVRMDFAWGGTERKAGEYDFSAYDRLMTSLDKHGIRALFILDYANKLYDDGMAPRTDAGRTAFAKWAAAAATHFKGRGILWEMWNEPNIGFWKPEPNVTNYVALALAVGKALRAAAPDEAYCGPGTSRIDLPFLEECFRGGLLEYWSSVTVHPYRHQSGPETVVPEYGRLRDLIVKHAPKGKAIPIVSGEWGFSAAWNGFDAASQGAMLPRQWLVNAACGIPLSIWYDWHDDGRDPKEAEHNFGTVSNALHAGRTPIYDPKPAYLAATTLNRELDGFRFVRRLSPPRAGAESSAEDWVLLFRRGSEVRLAAWTTAADPQRIVLPGPAAPVKAVGYTGAALPDLVPDAAGLVVPLTRDPVYLVPSAGDAAKIESATFRQDWSDGRIVAVTQAPGPDGALLVTVEKAFGPRLRGRLTLAADGRDAGSMPLDVEAGAARATLTVKTTAPAGSSVAVRIEREDGLAVFHSKPRRLASVTGFETRTADFSIHANTDGKGATASTQTLSAVAAPAGLPVGPGEALHLDASVDAGYLYLCLVHRDGTQTGITGRPTALGVWVHAQGDPATLSCRIQDASGETFQSAHARLENGWQYVELSLAGQNDSHWGGNDNGVADLPVKWQALLLIDRDHKRPYRGTLHFARPALIHEP
ncbi:MAG: hypothetical protein FJ221_13960 [Lentisphaerae bacterium]|nr:hypothetical protein [Lentisphaerota bacterium]